MKKHVSRKLMIVTSLFTVIGLFGVYITSIPDESFLKDAWGGWNGPCDPHGACGGQTTDPKPPGESYCTEYNPPHCGSGWCGNYCAAGEVYESCRGSYGGCSWSLVSCSSIFKRACESDPLMQNCICKPYGQPVGECKRGNC